MKYYKQYIGDETPTEITYTDALNTLLTTYQDNEITRKMLAEEGVVRCMFSFIIVRETE